MYQLQSYTLYMDLVDELSEGEIQFIECLSDDEQFSLISSVEKTPEKQTTSMTACSVETLPEITTPLYHSAAITQFQSLMLLLLFAIRNALSGKGITELLQLVRVHLPSSARMPSTVYSLRQFFYPCLSRVQWSSPCLLQHMSPNVTNRRWDMWSGRMWRKVRLLYMHTTTPANKENDGRYTITFDTLK